MYLKTLTLLAISLLSLSSNSQSFAFKIERTETFNQSYKKIATDSISKGTIIVDLVNTDVTFYIAGKTKVFDFNDSHEIKLFEDDHTVLYEFNNYTMPAKNQMVRISYSDDYRYSEEYLFEGMISLYENGIIKQYYVSKTDKEITDLFEYVTLLRESCNNISYDWVKTGTASDKVVYFIRSSYLTNDYIGIKVWVRSLNATFKYKNVTYKNVEQKILMTFDCNEKKILQEDILIYDSNRKIISSSSGGYYDWKYVVPESVGEMLLNKVCKMFVPQNP